MKRLSTGAMPAALIMPAGFTATSGGPELLFFLVLSAGFLFFVLILGSIFLYNKNIRLRNHCEEQITKLAAIYRAVPDLLFCKDANCAYTNCNNSFEHLTGRKESEIVGKTAWEIYSPDTQPIEKIEETDKRVMHENSMLTTQEWLTYPDGTRRLMEIVKVPLLRNGVVTGLLGTARNITEYSAGEEKAREASRVKSAFLAHMSHEIRTPLNAIIGMTELLLRDALSKQAHESALIIQQSSISLLSIVNDILDFSKIEAGKLIIVPEEYSFSSLIHDVVNIIRMRTVKKSVTFVVNVDCNIPGMLIGDTIRIRQIFLNILSNAVKYTNEGFISLTVTCDVQADSAVLTVEVSDSGVGIKEELLGKLFDDFVQIDPEKNKKIEGTGLGLAITKSLCTAMGGEVTVKSTYGSGSTFTVVLPQQFIKVGKFAHVENPEQKQVLVYEPRSIYAESIARSLANLGVDGVVVAKRSEFFEELIKNQYPFVFAPYFLLEVVEFAFEELGLKPKLVVMTEFDEFLSSNNIRTIATPLYSLPIANILNDAEDSKYPWNNVKNVSLIAPSAKILIVDDFSTNLKVIEGLLSPYKMRMDTCNTGRDAVNMAKKYRYDIIFMDHMMPGMDGIEATGEIRALEDGSGYYSDLPIIALTANIVSGMREIFLKSGFNALLPKPVEPSKLYALLEKWIPLEKFEKIKEEEDVPASELIEIEGIDIKMGISLNGGKLGNYLETLAIFSREGTDKPDEIRDCLRKNDIKQYATYVHALKSASLTVGAVKLSDFARTLEIAGRNGAITFLMENTETFLAELEALLLNINYAFARIQDQNEDPDTNDFNFFKMELCKLKTSLQRMDAGEINSNIAVLVLHIKGKKNRDTITKLSQLILEFEYDEAINLIDGLL